VSEEDRPSPPAPSPPWGGGEAEGPHGRSSSERGEEGRILAVDHGEKRIGIAVSDELGILASPLCILTPLARERVNAVAMLVREQQAIEVVVGYPRTLRDEVGPQARRVERFAASLQRAVSVPVRLWDERYSTAEAIDRLTASHQGFGGRRSGGRRARQALQVDAVAAAVILQEYLDSRRSSSSSSPYSPSP
jgi:putative Holliday junction resolvase